MQSVMIQDIDQIEYSIPIIIRGKVIKDYTVTFQGRNGANFNTPNAVRYLNQIPLTNPSKMADLYDLNTSEIVDFLDDLGKRLILEENEHLREAYKLACDASGLTSEVLRTTYKTLPLLFQSSIVEEMIESRIGKNYLDGWVQEKLLDGRTAAIRAFGSRSVHLIAGNVPNVSAASLIRSCVTRSDSIFKLPSNDPLTTTALIQTMLEMDPNHPLTKHQSVLYWKGGDNEFEIPFYSPSNLSKIIAWGGFSAIKYISQYLQPGLDLIAFNPKISISVIGKEAFKDFNSLNTVAQRAAIDVGAYNQETCLSARIIYVQSGTDVKGIEKINLLGEQLYNALVTLPSHVSTSPKKFDPVLKEYIDGIRFSEDYYRIYGGFNQEGAVIVSQFNDPVDFSHLLCSRVVNLVPVDSIDSILNFINSYTQTCGVYPERLKLELRDKLPLYGVQRIVSLGFAANGSLALPQDAIEPLRRMCNWITDESSIQLDKDS